tara:strand:- start:7199 stop:7435 length:237 start_codon:yes stop_codon:yes gene_type:complete
MSELDKLMSGTIKKATENYIKQLERNAELMALYAPSLKYRTPLLPPEEPPFYGTCWQPGCKITPVEPEEKEYWDDDYD